ncbi:MAG: NADH-quinone oxidoreductase subunit L [Bryobacteraceae bacterium]|nr:NADH-quinone oxidoreductase subunit L [Bryobacteraceae bacterium]
MLLLDHLWILLALPLAGAGANGLLGRRWSKRTVDAVAVGASGLAFLAALELWREFAQLTASELPWVRSYFPWLVAGEFRADFALQIDQLTLVLVLVVTGVGWVIHIYSTGYMAGDTGYARFFAYLNLFLFFMLLLVMAANFPLLFVGWEGVGLSSYLLIGFWFLKKSATEAGKKAFIVNRIGDFGFSLAIYLIVVHFGTLDFTAVFSAVASRPVETGAGLLAVIGLLLLVGATGKSAQVPLYVWLPDAMEGPTPVSALIHAATMVTAGVYMTARCAPIYLHAPLAMEAVAWVGAITALFAATIGLTQFDIKKVFAYSTISQLGYMFLGAGAGAFSAGIYHLVTHAFFKALLFLGAGSLIHALGGEQDLRKMGGLRKHAPVTFWTLLCAAVAIAGVPPFSGFHSKDAILLAAHRHSPALYWIGVVTAVLTAFYVFRAMFLAFFGDYRGDPHHHPHESPPVMTVPLGALALLSLAGGYFHVPAWLAPMFPASEPGHDTLLVAISVLAGLAGIAAAWWFYVARPGLADRVADRLGVFYRLVYNKYFVDEIYAAAVVRPVVEGSDKLAWRGVDVAVIDGIVNGVAARAQRTGAVLRRVQSGNVRSYAAWVLFGAVLVIVAFGFWGGWQ